LASFAGDGEEGELQPVRRQRRGDREAPNGAAGGASRRLAAAPTITVTDSRPNDVEGASSVAEDSALDGGSSPQGGGGGGGGGGGNGDSNGGSGGAAAVAKGAKSSFETFCSCTR